MTEKGLALNLHAYQHHVFMDRRFVDGRNWELVSSDLNGVGIESMQAKYEERFGLKEEVVPVAKARKPRKKATPKTSTAKGKAVTKKSTTKTAAKKPAAVAKKTISKKSSTKTTAAAKKTTAKKPKATVTKSTTAKKTAARKTTVVKVTRKN